MQAEMQSDQVFESNLEYDDDLRRKVEILGCDKHLADLLKHHVPLETAKLNAHGANQYQPCNHKVEPKWGTNAHWIARRRPEPGASVS